MRKVLAFALRFGSAGLVLAASVGCAERHARPQVPLPDIEVPAQAVKELRLIECDIKVSPPHCRTMFLHFDERQAVIHYKIPHSSN